MGTRLRCLVICLSLESTHRFGIARSADFCVKRQRCSDLILVGNHVEWTKKTIPLGVKVELVPTWQEAAEKLKERLSRELCILVKASAWYSSY